MKTSGGEPCPSVRASEMSSSMSWVTSLMYLYILHMDGWEAAVGIYRISDSCPPKIRLDENCKAEMLTWQVLRRQNRANSDHLHVITVPKNSMAAMAPLAVMGSHLSKTAPIVAVKINPKIWALQFKRPEEVPSGAGYVISAANSKPTGRYPVMKNLLTTSNTIIDQLLPHRTRLGFLAYPNSPAITNTSHNWPRFNVAVNAIMLKKDNK